VGRAVNLAASLALIAGLVAALAVAQPPKPNLYLLAGTPTPDGATGFPVRLYTVAGGRLALVRQIADGLFSVANDLAGHLYVLHLGMRKLSVIHENAPGEVDVVSAPPGINPDQDFLFYYPTWGAVAGPGVSPSAVMATWTDHWTITRIYAHAPRGKPRITPGDWHLYLYYRYQGPSGGPYRQSTVPGGTIDDGRIMMPYTLAPGVGYLGPTPPFLPPQAGVVAGYRGRPRGADLVADTARFFAFDAPVPSAHLPWPRTTYVLNKATRRWSVMKVPFRAFWPRLFGDWLATTVQEPNPEGHESPGLENERAKETDAYTSRGLVREFPRVRGVYPQNVYMPGKLLLQNLDDDRKVTIDSGQQDSEVLAVRKGGLVLYRVNDEIFSAQIQGKKLGPSKLVVKGKDVPEVHWVFWSNAPAEPAPGAKPAAKR
jgi:hypothetical protein